IIRDSSLRYRFDQNDSSCVIPTTGGISLLEVTEPCRSAVTEHVKPRSLSPVEVPSPFHLTTVTEPCRSGRTLHDIATSLEIRHSASTSIRMTAAVSFRQSEERTTRTRELCSNRRSNLFIRVLIGIL